MDTNLLIILIAILIATNMLTLIVLIERRSARPKKAEAAPVPIPKMSDTAIAQIEAKTQASFEALVNKASLQFNQDLSSTSGKLNDLIIRLTTSVVEEELSEYRKGLAAARGQALQSLASMQKTIEEQQSVLQADMQAAVQNRKNELMQQVERKLGVVATNYIVEALGQGVDLGAQREYLLASLERNKEALKKDITGEL